MTPSGKEKPIGFFNKKSSLNTYPAMKHSTHAGGEQHLQSMLIPALLTGGSQGREKHLCFSKPS